MSKICLDIGQLERSKYDIEGIKRRTSEIMDMFISITNSMDEDICRRGIYKELRIIRNRLENIDRKSYQMQFVLADAIKEYKQTEVKLKNLMDQFVTDLDNELTHENKKSFISDGIKGIFNKINDWYICNISNIKKYFKDNNTIINNKLYVDDLQDAQEYLNPDSEENNINQILNSIPDLKTRISMVPYSTEGKIIEIQRFLNEKGYKTDKTGELDNQTRNSLLLYTNTINSRQFKNINQIILPANRYVNNENKSNNKTTLHADGFGKRGDNYYLCNLGYEDYFNVYTVSAEANIVNTIEKGNVNLKAVVGASALDVEATSKNIGWDNFYGNVGGEAEVLTANAYGAFKFGKSGYGVSGNAIAAGASGQIKGKISIFGVDISAIGTGYAGAFGGGVDAMYEYKNGRRELKVGLNLAALFGLGGKIVVSW